MDPLQHLKKLPRPVHVLGIFALAVLYSVVGMASHGDQRTNLDFGHQENLAQNSPHFLEKFTYPDGTVIDWHDKNMSAKVILGQSLTVSLFPCTGDPQCDPDLSSRLNTALGNWNSRLRNGTPVLLTFDVFTRTSDSNESADIRVRWSESACSQGSVACALDVSDFGQANIWIREQGWIGSSPSFRTQALGHELGHSMAHLNEHYAPLDAWNTVSVMGNYCCLATWPTDHDLEDFHNAYRQAGWLGTVVAGNYIERIGTATYRVAWEPVPFVNEKGRQHSECNFIIDRSTTVEGSYSLYSYGARNTRNQNGIGSCGESSGGAYSGPSPFIPASGQHHCFRVRTETQVFPANRYDDHYGAQSSSDCISRSSSALVVATTDKSDHVYARVYNESVTQMNSVHVRVPFTTTPICSPTSVSPGSAHTCAFDPSDVGALEVWHDGALAMTIEYDVVDHR
jgi:hypothetical protein